MNSFRRIKCNEFLGNNKWYNINFLENHHHHLCGRCCHRQNEWLCIARIHIRQMWNRYERRYIADKIIIFYNNTVASNIQTDKLTSQWNIHNDSDSFNSSSMAQYIRWHFWFSILCVWVCVCVFSFSYFIHWPQFVWFHIRLHLKYHRNDIKLQNRSRERLKGNFHDDYFDEFFAPIQQLDIWNEFHSIHDTAIISSYSVTTYVFDSRTNGLSHFAAS